MAAEIADCTVSADSVSATAGGTVTVPIRISGNRGFTNFGIALDYDREQLELLSIQTAEGETPYLCGTTVAVNTQWTAFCTNCSTSLICSSTRRNTATPTE